MNAEERTRRIRERKVATGNKWRIWSKGTWSDFDIYRVEVEALLLNVDNRRFAAERNLMEHKLKNTLDPESKAQDLKSIIAILLDKNLDVDGDVVVGSPSKDYNAIRDDWLKRGQETPFWIRPDGLVRNGNRRLAMLLRLREEKGNGAFDWVEAIILDPDSISEDDLFAMEQREQLTENFKLRYTDVNLLLTIRDAAIAKYIDWGDTDDLERVGSELQDLTGGDKRYAVKQLRAIKYMDAYLENMNASGQYHRLLRQVERFRDVGWLMSKMAEHPAADQADMLRLAFAAIQGGNPHGHIRKLWSIFVGDKRRYKALLKKIEAAEEEWDKSIETAELEDPELPAEPEGDDDADEDTEPPGTSVRGYPSAKVRSQIENAVDGFVAANLDIASIAAQALDRLITLKTNEKQVKAALKGDQADDIRATLDAIMAWGEDAKTRYK